MPGIRPQTWRPQRVRRGRVPRAGPGFTPFQAPTSPPPGTYDPSLDASVNAANRGLGDLTQDTDTANQRATSDLGLTQAGFERQRSRGMTDIGYQRDDVNTGYGRGIADLLRDRTREGENYATSTQALARNYGNLGEAQRGSIQAAGLGGGGALAQALRKRAANQGIERQGLDVAHQRANEDFGTTETRLGENRDTALGRLDESGRRLNQDVDVGEGGALTDYARGQQDRGTDLTRAQRENTFYGQDVAATKFFQAGQVGYVPPTGPSNEFKSPGGITYRVLKRRGGNLFQLSSGRRTTVRPR